MGKITPAPEDILKQELEALNITTEELVQRYGVPVSIDMESAHEAMRHGYENRIFCTMLYDNNPLGNDYGESGMHYVNVMERYFFPKDLPNNLFVEDINYNVLGG